jgi:hypothetical protein
MKKADERWRDVQMQEESEGAGTWRQRNGGHRSARGGEKVRDGHLSASQSRCESQTRGGENQNQNQSACQMTDGRAERQGLANSDQPWSARRSDEKQKLKIGYQKKNGQLEPEGLPTCHHEKQSAYRPKSDEKQKSKDGEKLVPRGTHHYEIQNVRCP